MMLDPWRKAAGEGRTATFVRRLYQAIDQQDCREIRRLFDLDSQLRETCTRFGASPWAFAKFGYKASTMFHTPLQYACMVDTSGIVVSCLLKLGCWVNNLGSLQVTPLHIACKYSNERVVRLLLAYNPSLSAKDGRGRTARHVAKDPTIIDLLTEAEKVNEQKELDYDWVMIEKHDIPTLRHSRQASGTYKPEYEGSPPGGGIAEMPVSPRPTYQFGDLTRSFLRSVGRLGYGTSPEAMGSFTTFGLIPFEQLELERKLGRGGFGTVWQARWGNVTLAAKVLRKRPGQQLKHEIMNEIRMFCLLSECQHPNIITFMGACSVGETLCLCTEFATAGSLFDLIHTNKKEYDLRTVRRWGVDVAVGMHYLVGRGIIHRDLKSPNILLSDREFDIDDFNSTNQEIPLEHLVCKICDFGLSRELGDPSEVQMGGTFRWMAPEVMRNSDVTFKSDVFSMGTVLWELVTRSLPFDGKNPAEVIYGVVQNDLRPHVPASFPQSTRALVESCWQKQPEHRPTFSEVSEFLRDCDMVSRTASVGGTPYELAEDSPRALSMSQSDWSREIAEHSARAEATATVGPEQLRDDAPPLLEVSHSSAAGSRNKEGSEGSRGDGTDDPFATGHCISAPLQARLAAATRQLETVRVDDGVENRAGEQEARRSAVGEQEARRSAVGEQDSRRSAVESRAGEQEARSSAVKEQRFRTAGPLTTPSSRRSSTRRPAGAAGSDAADHDAGGLQPGEVRSLQRRPQPQRQQRKV